MNNIFSYLTWRGDLKLTQSPFNEVDNLVLSTLSYLDFSGIVPKNGKQDITIQRAAAEYFSLHGIPQRPDPEKASSLELREWMLYLMADTCRFRNTALSSITLLRIRHNAANLEGDSTEAITNAVRNALTAQPALVRRILQAFPEASIYNKRVIANMKERRKRLESEIKDAKSRAKTALELKEKAMQDSLSQYSSKIHKL